MSERHLNPDTLPPPLPPSPPGVRLDAPRRRRRRWRLGPRVHAALMLLTLLSLAFAGGLQWEGVGIDEPLSHWLQPQMLGRIVAAGWLYALCVFAILGSHELGHYLACRLYGIPATLPFFVPGPPPLGSFGAVIRIRGIIPNRKALFDVAAAGPIAGFAVALPVLIAGLLRATPSPLPVDEPGTVYLGPPLLVALLQDRFFPAGMVLDVRSLFGAGWVGMLVTSLNLFPVGQLDGGHAAYALSRRLHRWLARVTLIGLLLLLAFQFVYLGQVPAYLLWFLILLWMRDRHPQLLDETTPLGPGRKLVAVLLAIIFLASFIPVPFFFTG